MKEWFIDLWDRIFHKKATRIMVVCKDTVLIKKGIVLSDGKNHYRVIRNVKPKHPGVVIIKVEIIGEIPPRYFNCRCSF